MKQNNSYNQDLKTFAKNLRKDSTKAEVRIWCELLRQGKTGYNFLRQGLLVIILLILCAKN